MYAVVNKLSMHIIGTYPWAVYCEGPPSFIQRGGEGMDGGGGEGQKSEEHFYSSLQKTFTFKTSKPNLKVEYLKNGTR